MSFQQAPYAARQIGVAQFCFGFPYLGVQEIYRVLVGDWRIFDDVKNGRPRNLKFMLVSERYAKSRCFPAAVAEGEKAASAGGQPLAASLSRRREFGHFGKQRLGCYGERERSSREERADCVSAFFAVGTFRDFIQRQRAGISASAAFAGDSVYVNRVPFRDVAADGQQHCLAGFASFGDYPAIFFPPGEQTFAAVLAAVKREGGTFAVFADVSGSAGDGAESQRCPLAGNMPGAVVVEAYGHAVGRSGQQVKAVGDERVGFGFRPRGRGEPKQGGGGLRGTRGRASEQRRAEFVQANMFFLPKLALHFVDERGRAQCAVEHCGGAPLAGGDVRDCAPRNEKAEDVG